jgi:hypothetical protein
MPGGEDILFMVIKQKYFHLNMTKYILTIGTIFQATSDDEI